MIKTQADLHSEEIIPVIGKSIESLNASGLQSGLE